MRADKNLPQVERRAGERRAGAVRQLQYKLQYREEGHKGQ